MKMLAALSLTIIMALTTITIASSDTSANTSAADISKSNIHNQSTFKDYPVDGEELEKWYDGEGAPRSFKGLLKVTDKGYVFLVFRSSEDTSPKAYRLSFYDEDAEIEARDIIEEQSKNNNSDSKRNINIIGYPKGSLIEALYGLEPDEDHNKVILGTISPERINEKYSDYYPEEWSGHIVMEGDNYFFLKTNTLGGEPDKLAMAIWNKESEDEIKKEFTDEERPKTPHKGHPAKIIGKIEEDWINVYSISFDKE